MRRTLLIDDKNDHPKSISCRSVAKLSILSLPSSDIKPIKYKHVMPCTMEINI